VTFFADSSPYSYLPEQAGPPARNVGWLDGTEPFEKGPVDEAFIAKLRELCRTGVNRTRGYHQCNLCAQPSDDGFRRPTTVRHPEGRYAVGSAEIRVDTLSGVTYAAPDMIIHYVEKHGYRPPDDFVQAVTGAG
jgi:hypothetical protein